MLQNRQPIEMLNSTQAGHLLPNIKQVSNNISVKLSNIDENESIRKERSKFQSIDETEAEQNRNTKNNNIITEENINTEENLSSDEQPLKTPNSYDSYVKNCTYEFSVSTLDRKLKELSKIKKDTHHINRRNSISDDELQNGSQKNHINLNQEPVSNRIHDVTIIMNPSKLINDHLNEIQLRIIGHTRSAAMYEKREKIIGYPATLLSSFTTSSIMLTITSDNENNAYIIKYISLVLSIMLFLLSVSRDYLNFARKFQSHDLSSKLYTTLLRSIEVRLIKNHITKDDRRDIFKDIVDQMSIIEQYEIPIPGNIDSKIRSEHVKLNN